MDTSPNTNDTERARDALFYIEPSCSRDEWVTIGMAAKSAGLSFDDFHDWSAKGENYKNQQDCRTVWRSFKESGGITPATLYDEAFRQGWKANGTARPKIANVSHAQRDPVKKPDNPAPKTWEMCIPAPPDNPYIIRKHGQPDGLRIYPDNAPPLIIKKQNVAGWLAVPAWSNGEVQTIQFIPPNGGEKLNHPGASFNDGFFSVGAIPNNDYADEIHINEGIGQAWAANQTTKAPAIVCFGEGRMQRVAKVLRAKYPNAKLVIVPDRGKEAAAAKIAAAVSGCYIEMPSDKPSNYDVNDYLLEFGDDALAGLLSKTKSPPPPHDETAFVNDGINYEEMPDYGESATQEPKAFKFIDAVELMNQTYEPDYLIEGLFERNTLGQFFGPTGHCKSFVVQDMCYCIAAGIDYHGLVTQQGNVAYVCGEGKEGLKRRLRALQIKYGEDIKGKLAISEQPGAFIDIGVTAEVAEAIKAIGNVILVVVDTYHRNMGGGNENSADDFAQVLRNIDTFLKPLGVTVATVHHSGHYDTDRSRGSSAIRAAMDFEYMISKNGEHVTMKATKIKDGPIPEPMLFKLVDVDLGISSKGYPITSAYLDYQGIAKKETSVSKPSRQDDAILTCLNEAIAEHGVTPTDEIRIKFGGFDSLEGKLQKIVHIDDWRRLAYRAITVDSDNPKGEQEARRQAFKRSREKLQKLNLVVIHGNYAWRIFSE